MVKLLNKEIDLSAPKKADFSPSFEGLVVGAFLIEEDSYILVEELIGAEITASYFCTKYKAFISREDRFNKYNGEIEVIKRNGFDLFSEIKIDINLGTEYVIERVERDGEVLYNNSRFRYTQHEIDSLWERFLLVHESSKVQQSLIDKQVEDFSIMDMQSKVNYLRARFRTSYRTRSELGVMPEEVFLSKSELLSFRDIDGFERALLLVLELEEDIVGKSAQDMFSNIFSVLVTK